MIKVNSKKNEVVVCGTKATLICEISELLKRILEAGISELEILSELQKAKKKVKGLTTERILEMEYMNEQERAWEFETLMEIFGL